MYTANARLLHDLWAKTFFLSVRPGKMEAEAAVETPHGWQSAW